MGRKPVNLIGKHFGKLTPIKRLKRKDPYGCYYWTFLCDPAYGGCGNKTTLSVSHVGGNKYGTRSCGCGRGNSGRLHYKTKRNANLYSKYQSGVSGIALAREYKITKQCVYQIIRKEASRRGETLRKRSKPHKNNKDKT